MAADTPVAALQATVRDLQRDGIRVSVFIDPDLGSGALGGVARRRSHRALHRAVRPRVRGGRRRGKKSFAAYVAAARLAHSLGLGINAGHDLDLDNLTLFRTLPHLDEVSIGHALISHALYVGLDRAVRDYLAALSEGAGPTRT